MRDHQLNFDTTPKDYRWSLDEARQEVEAQNFAIE